MAIWDRFRRKSLVNNTRDGGIPVSWPSNWFQLGYKPLNSTGGSVIEACISAYARTVAQCPGRHYRVDEYGVKTYVPFSALSEALHQPNDFQTISDFLLNLVYQLYLNGNAYVVASEDRTKMFLLDPRQTHVSRVQGTPDVFYSTGGMFAETMSPDGSNVLIPERYVGHIRLHTPQDPLIGVTPIQAAAASVATNNAIGTHQAAFFTNASRPSGVLTTDMELTKDQMIMLRQAWEDQSKALNSGGVPILSNGIKWEAMSMSNQDAETVAALKYTVEDISRVFGVPPMMINSMENATFNNAESLMQFWLASGLGFLVNHIEKALAKLYRLPAGQGVELDTEVLLRSDLKARMEAFGDAVTKGIYSPNDVRQREGLPAVEGGNMPRVQQQMIPLDAPPNTAQLAAPSPAEPADDEDEEDLSPEDEERSILMLAREDLKGMFDANIH
jgi:HK97 family phage portal protein